MFYERELYFLQRALRKCRIQSRVIRPDRDACSAFGFWENVPFRTQEKTFYEWYPNVQENTLYRAGDGLGCRYMFMLLPWQITPQILLIGPYLDMELTHQQVYERLERLGIPAKLGGDLEWYYASMPLVKGEAPVYAMVSAFAECIWGDDKSYKTADADWETPSLLSYGEKALLSHDQQRISHRESVEQRYDYEREIIDAVSRGDLHRAEFLMSAVSDFSFEKRVSDELRNLKNYCIIMNTLFRKAAERGGVHPVHIDMVSSDFARMIENITSVAQSRELMQTMVKRYCRMVQENAIRSYSQTVQKVIVAIDLDLSGDLSLRALAAQNNVSAGYLSDLFSKETGQTLTSYVNHKRMTLATHLLKSSSLQIQTIAQHCGILDLHYFCRLFKKHTGMTPSEYRKERTRS